MNSGVLLKEGQVLIPAVEVARSLPRRMVGLLGRSGLEPGCAMHIAPCSGIHTFFMRFRLDLVFLSRSMRVVRVVRNVPAWTVVAGGIKAHSVLEMQSGWLPDDALSAGDEVALATAECEGA